MGFQYPKDIDGNEVHLGDRIQDADGGFLGTVGGVLYDSEDDNPLLEYKSLAYGNGQMLQVRSTSVRRLESMTYVEEAIMKALVEEFENMRLNMPCGTYEGAVKHARNYKPRRETARRYAEVIERAR